MVVAAQSHRLYFFEAGFYWSWIERERVRRRRALKRRFSDNRQTPGCSKDERDLFSDGTVFAKWFTLM
jgi:hypothetical protein